VSAEAEIEAMRKCASALGSLTPEARLRVLRWVMDWNAHHAPPSRVGSALQETLARQEQEAMNHA
jgi:hypothetical protein